MKAINNHPDGGWRLRPDDLWFQGAQDSGVIYRYDGKSLHRLKFPETTAGKEFISKFPRSKYPHMTFNPYDVYSIYKDSKGSLWFGTNLGVCHYNGETFRWISEKELGIDAIAFHVRSTVEDKKGNFWFSNTMHQFNVYAGGAGSVNAMQEKGIGSLNGYNSDDYAYFMSGLEDENGDLWIATYDKGAWRYDGRTMTQFLIKGGEKPVTLFSVYKDREGSIWLGTHNAGVYKFNGKTFERYKI